MGEFFDLCIQAISLDDSKERIRSTLFEKQVCERLTSLLGIESTSIPVRPGYKMDFRKQGEKDYGDVDFSFIWDGILVNIDAKSWQKTAKHLRGRSVDMGHRCDDMIGSLEGKVIPRGARLARLLTSPSECKNRHLQLQSIQGVLSFLCTPGIEHVAPDISCLWYGNTPSVLTAAEIADLFRNKESFRTVRQYAASKAP